MSNFVFIPDQFGEIARTAQLAEGHILGDPRAACFHCRFALESMVHWLYRHDPALNLPYDQKLNALLHETSFQNLLPQAVFQKARAIQKVGNLAAHSAKPLRQIDAMQAVKELHHVCYWLVRTYAPDASREGAAWDIDQVPRSPAQADTLPRQDLAKLESELEVQRAEALKAQQARDALDAELQALRAEVERIRAASEMQPDTHDYSEAETRDWLIDLELKRAGWPLNDTRNREYEVTGMPTARGIGFADYVLWGEDGKPLAVVEAKRSSIDPEQGRQQAKLYADCLEQMHGQRPLIFYTNGHVTWLWDDQNYPPRRVAGFYQQDELERLIRRREQRGELDVAMIRDEIAGRYYQKRAIGSIFRQFGQARRKALLVMATGTGKTRTSIALVDALQRAGWAKRALFLADRTALVRQAVNAFKAHLPESSPVNLVTEKATEGRVYACTYPTMLNLINQLEGGKARFGVGYFDLVIIDEAHRSVYQKYGAIFQYFDALLVGLTATPREEVDRNTYELFELEPGVPTDAYELSQAVKDDFLVPPKVQQVDLKFPRDGIDYDQLSDEEKAQWESLDWGDDIDPDALPDRVNAAAVNSWLFNRDTVDKVLQHLMEKGHKVAGGDRLAKTIIFARNHDHAVFLEKRFNHHYPQYAGNFARVVDNYEKRAESLIDDFSAANRQPQIAISVDMLDTGIDVPEVANLVFFKPVYSKIKFWQMIGRGTRLCPDLYGPGQHKEDFRIFDFCFNFDFFNENPDGIQGGDSAPLGTRLFRARVGLLTHVQACPELDPDRAVKSALIERLHQEVAKMNRDNFIVRLHSEAVEKFQQREAWDKLSEEDRMMLETEVAGLPSEMKTDQVESRMFDLTVLRMQLAQLEADESVFERHRKRVVEMAALLEEKAAIPAVKAQLEYLAAMAEMQFWEGLDLNALEELRMRLRALIPLLDGKTRHIVYTDFEDEVQGVREIDAVPLPQMTGAQYEKKVRDYLRKHRDHLVIHRLRSNQPLTPTDLESLEQTLVEIGEDEGQSLLSDLLARSQAPSLAWFVRKLVGMDRAAAQEAFADFLSDRSLNDRQIRFIETLIDQLTNNGIVEAGTLYEPPFSDLSSGGPEILFAGRENVVERLFDRIETIKTRLDPERQAEYG